MQQLYTREYVENTLAVLEDNITELENWSILHNDEFSEQLELLTIAYKRIVNKLKELDLEDQPDCQNIYEHMEGESL